MTFPQFFRLVRPRTLTAAFSPVVLGAAYAYASHTPAHPIAVCLAYTLMVLACVISAQMAANMWNEYFDFKSGLDLNQAIGNSGSIVREGIAPSQIKRLAVSFTIFPLCLGLFLSALVTWWFIPAGILCILVSLLYSGGPKPLSRTPFGEVASGLAMGFAIVMITAFVWTDALTWDLLIPAVPSTILIGTIMMTNNLRDFSNDKVHGRRTLVICIGKSAGIQLLAILFAFCNAWLVGFAFAGLISWWSLAAVVYTVPAMRAVRILDRYADSINMDAAMKFSAMGTTVYHILFAAGLLIGR